MMIELSFIVCLLESPEKCKEEHLMLNLENTMQCMMVSQQELAKWVEKNPKYAIRRWTCSAAIHKDI